MDGMLLITMTLAAMALAVLLIVQLRRRYGSGDGGYTHLGNDDSAGDGGGGD